MTIFTTMRTTITAVATTSRLVAASPSFIGSLFCDNAPPSIWTPRSSFPLLLFSPTCKSDKRVCVCSLCIWTTRTLLCKSSLPLLPLCICVCARVPTCVSSFPKRWQGLPTVAITNHYHQPQHHQHQHHHHWNFPNNGDDVFACVYNLEVFLLITFTTPPTILSTTTIITTALPLQQMPKNYQYASLYYYYY